MKLWEQDTDGWDKVHPRPKAIRGIKHVSRRSVILEWRGSRGCYIDSYYSDFDLTPAFSNCIYERGLPFNTDPNPQLRMSIGAPNWFL